MQSRLVRRHQRSLFYVLGALVGCDPVLEDPNASGSTSSSSSWNSEGSTTSSSSEDPFESSTSGSGPIATTDPTEDPPGGSETSTGEPPDETTGGTAACGDGQLDPGEACDDGNDDDTDDCTNACVAAACGDGIVQAGVEACDDGNDDDTDACTTACVAAACGDGIVQAGVEACDDGNGDDTDACTTTCEVATCGDGIVHAGVEACDDGNDDDTDACTTTCAVATCGDGIVQQGEACDDANDDNTDACTTACMLAMCGDGFIQAGVEACDDGDANDNNGCLNNCTAASCGDGVVHTGVEECDDGNDDNTDACLNSCALPLGAPAAWSADLPMGADAREIAIGVDGHVFVTGAQGGAPWVYELDELGNEVGSMSLDPTVAGIPAANDIGVSIGTADGLAYVLVDNDDRRWVAAVNVQTDAYVWTTTVDDAWLPPDEEFFSYSFDDPARIDASADGHVVLAHQLLEHNLLEGTAATVHLYEFNQDTGALQSDLALPKGGQGAQIRQFIADAARGALLRVHEHHGGNSWSRVRRVDFAPTGLEADDYYLAPQGNGDYSYLMDSFGVGGAPDNQVAIAQRLFAPGIHPTELFRFHGTDPNVVSSTMGDPTSYDHPLLVLDDGDIIAPHDSGATRIHTDGTTTDIPVAGVSGIVALDSRYEGASSTAVLTDGGTRVVHVAW